MNLLRNCCMLAIALMLLPGCKQKKKPSLSGEEPVEINDFIDFFPAKNVPYQIVDTTLNKKEKDSLLINQKVFSQFVPDSFMSSAFGKGAKLKIYPIGKINASGDENYLFTKVTAGDKRSAFVFAFNKKDELIDGIQLLQYGQYPNAQQLINMDKSYSIVKTVTRRNVDGTISDGKDVYGLDRESGKFMLIMTDPLDDKVTDVTNPIEDFPKKNKYAADYGAGKLNLVSIRDGRKPDRLRFFIHFDKSNGTCSGELKGEAVFTSATVAEYREGGDPCILRFNFSSSAVSLKEVDGCGAHRGLRCSFDGSFARKKEAKPPKKTPVKKK